MAGEYEEARTAVDRLLKAHPEDQDALGLAGNIMELLGSHDDARKYYEKVLELNPKNTQALIDLGDYYSVTENTERALEYYDTACRMLQEGIFYASKDHEVEQAYFGKASVLKNCGRIDDALRCLQEGLRLAPNADLLKNFDEESGDR